ncbi:MAG: protoheme IX farnesyltransferase [Bacteroidales bacterium]|nr:protoheme IX farnesyltransferase [Bacteroidales bacterium]MDT8431946.1 protoheme IX farnesyltransferase [Bacteroidales bacterium]
MSKSRNRELLTSLLQLGKIKISIPVALTGFLGYYRVSGSLDIGFIYAFFGIFFMSMGASTINHIQERKTDRLMKRTATRPIPAGRISLLNAVLAAVIFSCTGLGLLLLTGSVLAAAIGALTLAWYNLVYTPLKKITPFAVLPGAVIGALPPLIGWVAAGGYIADPEILLISLFLFIGQMPHYWLLLVKIGDEFSTAGMPVITDIFTDFQLRNISFTWIFAAAVSVLIFPVSGIMHSSIISFVMAGGVILFMIRMVILSFKGTIMDHWRTSFVTVNLFYLFIILILIADKFAEPYLYN